MEQLNVITETDVPTNISIKTIFFEFENNLKTIENNLKTNVSFRRNMIIMKMIIGCHDNVY